MRMRTNIRLVATLYLGRRGTTLERWNSHKRSTTVRGLILTRWPTTISTTLQIQTVWTGISVIPLSNKAIRWAFIRRYPLTFAKSCYFHTSGKICGRWLWLWRSSCLIGTTLSLHTHPRTGDTSQSIWLRPRSNQSSPTQWTRQIQQHCSHQN